MGTPRALNINLATHIGRNMIPINLKNFPGAVLALKKTSRFFLSSEVTQVAPAHSTPSSTSHPERALETAHEAQRMLELARAHLRMQRDLHLNAVLQRPILQRAGLHPEPDWFEVDQATLSRLPRALQLAVRVLHELDAELTKLSSDAAIRAAAVQQWQDASRVTKVAAKIMAVETRTAQLHEEIEAVYTGANRSGRALNIADERQLELLDAELLTLNADSHLALIHPSQLEALTDELNRLTRRHNRRELRTGLLRTPRMNTVINSALPALAQGRPVMLVGETGGAKTALATAMGREIAAKEPELVSFHGEINTYQLIGRDRIEVDGGMSFRPGPVLRAMQRGAALILDEVNAAPTEFLKRLNVILQLRPGDTFQVQEDTGSQVTVRPGFCVIATANEKSTRYRGVEVLSAELKNRFGTGVYRIGYPDSEIVLGAVPTDNLALAEAALCDDNGEMPVQLPAGQLLAFIQAAHATQKLFTGDYSDTMSNELIRNIVPVDRLIESTSAPALDDSVLSPRMVVSILEQVRDGLGRVQLSEVLKNWVAGIEKPQDREVLVRLLDSFLSDDGATLLGNRAWSPEPAHT